MTDAAVAIKDIVERGKIPLIVGGTMFYVKALLGGLAKLPPANSEIRDEYLSRYASLPDEERSAKLHQDLAKVDEQAAATIAPADEQRILRALELNRQSGLNLAELYSEQQTKIWSLRDYAKQQNHDIVTLGLAYRDRDTLRKKLAKRFRAFLQAGLVQEVIKLRQEYSDLDLSFPAIRSVGYRQVWEYLLQLEQLQPRELADGRGQHLEAEMEERAIIATRQLAKRQLTWLRSWDDLVQLDSLAPDLLGRALKKIA